jgi:glutathione S-transferase
MPTNLTFYTNPMSRGRMTRWMLEEVGCPYETQVLDYGTTMKAPEYLAIHPMGKVPAIKHGDAVVTESVAICTYLAEAFPEAKLAPAVSDHKARANYLRWLFFVAGPLEAAVTNKTLGIDIPQDKQGHVGYGSFEQTLGVIEKALKGKDYLDGKAFTTADLVLASYLGFYLGFKIIPSNPEFERYVKLHKNRPAALRAYQIDNELMPKKTA